MRHRLAALLGLLMVGSFLSLAAPAAAETQGYLTIEKGVDGWVSGHEVAPGETFDYKIVITCSNLGSGGCTNAALSDLLPDYLSVTGAVTVTGSTGTSTVSGKQVDVRFTEPLTDPAGGIGLGPASSVTVSIPVKVADSIPATESGKALTNTATVDADNADPQSDSFAVVPNIPVDLEATTAKKFAPDNATASPGTETTLTLTGGNGSNIGVDEITMVDPGDPPGSPNPFTYLEPTGDLDVTLPAGAEQVRVDVYYGGAWHTGTPGATAAYPPGTPLGQVTGIRVTFISTDDDPIPTGASGSIDLGLAQRDNIADAGEGPINNTVHTTVTAPNGDTSPEATDTAAYTISSSQISVRANKTFDPDAIAVNGTSTVTIGVTNSSTVTNDSMTITEPGAGGENMFENGLTFTGWTNGVSWPADATQAAVTFTYADGTSETLTSDAPDTLPDPDPGKTVVGFSVRWTGPIVPGAEASAPFTVKAASTNPGGVDEYVHHNVIDVTNTAPGGFSGTDQASDDLTTIIERLAVETKKKLTPSRILAIPGEIVTAQLTGHVRPFPESTTRATRLVVSDPVDPPGDFYDYFAPTSVVATPVPAGSTLTVQYYDGSNWVDVAGMTAIAGETIFSGDLPASVQANAQGIRFVYTDPHGYPPDTEVKPNINFELKAGVVDPTDPDPSSLQNCAASDASAPPVTAQTSDPACDDVELLPVEPGPGTDAMVKDWDRPKAVGERSQTQLGATLGWSTSGRSHVEEMYITDVPNPSNATVPNSVFDSFDLVRIDPITPAMDPLLTYDQITAVELYNATTGQWVKATNDPCPSGCDGTFPGVTLTSAERDSTIAFRLHYIESPTRAARINGDPTAPAVGSGVARSFEKNRQVHPVFQIRDERRSDSTRPVIADALYNTGDEGVVRNTAAATGYTGGTLVVSDQDSDLATITAVPVTGQIVKDWSGGPLGVPEPGTATWPQDYPSGRVSLDARNTTPRYVDRMTITEPVGSDAFDSVNIGPFVRLTVPSGATGVTITLHREGGGSTVLTSTATALALTEAQLADVVGFTVVYTGRIAPNALAEIDFDTRLRQTNRTTGDAVVAGPTLTNNASVKVEDLVGYPDVTPLTNTDEDDATIALRSRGIGVNTTKSFSPTSQTEPDNSNITMTLTGQPQGPSRTNWMQVTDQDPTFWNQYEFVGFGAGFALTAPINQVKVDVLTGDLTESGGDVAVGNPVWHQGSFGATPTLPGDVTDTSTIIGVRFTFQKADGTIWQNPSTPTQSMPITVKRRGEMLTGGKVPSDSVIFDPAPGESAAGVATNTIQTQVKGAELVNGEPIHAEASTTAQILYRHGRNSVAVTKSPVGAQGVNTDIPFVLNFTNNGAVPIVDPVMKDVIPSDASGPLLVFNPDATQPSDKYAFALAGAAPVPGTGPALPTDPAGVTIDEQAAAITFTFPKGTVLEVGQTYTITVVMRFRDGLAGATQVTNEAVISGQRPWDACTRTLSADSTECSNTTTVYPTKAAAIRGVKTVKAVDDELGVNNVAGDDADCVPNADGFYRGSCVPVTKPGADDVWRMTFTNSGNLPMKRVYAIDRLPVPGDTGAIIPGQRGSQWTPTLKAIALVGANPDLESFNTYYTTTDPICTRQLQGLACGPADWQLWDPTVDPTTVVALQFEFIYRDTALLQPGAKVAVDMTTTAPAQSETAGPDTVAWNTVAVGGQARDGNATVYAPRSEGNKVGVALATGPLTIEKHVEGPAAEYAPAEFTLTVTCTSVGEDVDLGGASPVTVTADEPVTISDLPWGSTCTVADDSASSGATHFSTETVTVGRDDDPVTVLDVTNTYNDASLTLAKQVSDSAEDQDGNPVQYGPFEFTVDCTFLGDPVYAAGYDTSNPMVVTFSSGESVTLAELPAGSECTATETDTLGAASTTATGSTGDDDSLTGDTSIDLTLTEDGEDDEVTNFVTFENIFDTGSLVIDKVVDGNGAAKYGAGPFLFRVHCADGDQVVWDDQIQLGGGEPLTRQIDKLKIGASCEVTETDDGGATHTSIDPNAPVQITSSQTPVTFTATNTFSLGSVKVTKVITGPAASYFTTKKFVVQLQCTREVNGQDVAVPISKDGKRTLSKQTTMVALYEDLPVGAECDVTELKDGGASSTKISPSHLTVGEDTVAQVTVTNRFGAELLPDHGNKNPTGPTSNTGGDKLDGRSPWLLVGACLAVLVGVVGGVLTLRRRAG